MRDIRLDFNSKKGVVNVYGQSMLFHCNHFNRYLQQTIEDPTYIDSEKILLQSAAETVYLQFSEYFKQNPDLTLREKLDFASQMFKFAGFGILDFSKIDEKGGRIIGRSSHFGLAMRLNLAKMTRPGEFFDKGFIAGVLLTIKGSIHGYVFEEGFSIRQTKSISLGDDMCIFEIDPEPHFVWIEKLTPKDLPYFVEIPERKFDTAIDENAIVRAVSGMELAGDERGLMPAFGVYLTRMYADYYNKISFRFENELVKATGGFDMATELLIESGHICAFNTLGGIMKSDEWKALVMPMIKNREDWIHGIVAVANALGWGIWRVEELIPDERLVMRVYEDYESLGHLRWFGKADHPISYLFTGGCAGLMNLIYHGDITKNPVLDKDYYYQLFKTQNHFKGRQTKCLAMGDDYSEVVVTRG
jgi:hypothetical protein